MAADVHVTREDLDALGAKLDALDLTPTERDLLAGVFAAARRELGDDEVEGFAFGPTLRLSDGFGGIFQPGKPASFPSIAGHAGLLKWD